MFFSNFDRKTVCAGSDGAPQLAPSKSKQSKLGKENKKLAADGQPDADRAASPPDDSPPSPRENVLWPPPASDANPIGMPAVPPDCMFVRCVREAA